MTTSHRGALEALRDGERPAARRHPWWPTWERAWAFYADVRDAMLAELRRAIGTYGARAGGRAYAAVRLQFAGTDVAPYVATEVWADGLADVSSGVRVFREAPAFTPRWLQALADAVDTEDALADHENFGALERFITLATLVLATECLEELAPIWGDVSWIAAPGHDRGTLVLIA